MSQTDKHSDLTSHSGGVTVMAVAADFHRDFLIPEQYTTCPTTQNICDDLRLFFCDITITHCAVKFKPFL